MLKPFTFDELGIARNPVVLSRLLMSTNDTIYISFREFANIVKITCIGYLVD